MIAGYHLIWTAYGWWLPNDPRGSMSREIRAAAIADLGELHYGRKRIQLIAALRACRQPRLFEIDSPQNGGTIHLSSWVGLVVSCPPGKTPVTRRTTWAK